MNLSSFLNEKYQDKDLKSVVLSIANGVKSISKNIKNCDIYSAGEINSSGDTQMALDLYANQLLDGILKQNNYIYQYASEEKEEVVVLNNNGKFSIAFDPLDGSSLIDVNLAIGSIFGIYKSKILIPQKGNNQVCAIYSLYGPRTTFFISFGNELNGFTLNDDGIFYLSHKNIKITKDSKLFSPGNLRAAIENEKYMHLIDKWTKQGKTLRYSGAMVADINAIFCKGQGIFSYPSHSKYPNGKLRILYECAPFAFLMKSAGGLTLDCKNNDILNIDIKDLHQRTTIFIGSENEVKETVNQLSK